MNLNRIPAMTYGDLGMLPPDSVLAIWRRDHGQSRIDCMASDLGLPVKPPVVCLPLMRIPAKPEKPTKYLPEMWKPNG